jgi:phosphoribosyl 1,2-cyclic phosphodiesterase
MKIGIAGTRGSKPTPSGKSLFDEDIITHKYGGNTTCVYVEGNDGSIHIIDAGTGIVGLGNSLIPRGFCGEGKTMHIYLSHTHWDHIQGIPFLGPAYIPGNKIMIYGESKDTNFSESLSAALNKNKEHTGTFPAMTSEDSDSGLREILETQQSDVKYFPVKLDVLKGIKEYHGFFAGDVLQTGDMKVETIGLNHLGGCVGYRFTETKDDGSKAVFVMATDHEPGEDAIDLRLAQFCAGADLLVIDTQYEPEGYESKINPFKKTWGHGDYVTALKTATDAEVKRAIGTHHEPKCGDAYYDTLEKRATTYAQIVAGNRNKPVVDFEFAKEGTWYNL